MQGPQQPSVWCAHDARQLPNLSPDDGLYIPVNEVLNIAEETVKASPLLIMNICNTWHFVRYHTHKIERISWTTIYYYLLRFIVIYTIYSILNRQILYGDSGVCGFEYPLGWGKSQTQMQMRTKIFTGNIVTPDVLSKEDIQEIQNYLPIFRDLWLQSIANSTRVWFLSHLLKRSDDDQGCVSQVFPYQWLAIRRMGHASTWKEHPAQVVYTHEFKTCHVELTICCCCAADGRFPKGPGLAYSSTLFSFQKRC